MRITSTALEAMRHAAGATVLATVAAIATVGVVAHYSSSAPTLAPIYVPTPVAPKAIAPVVVPMPTPVPTPTPVVAPLPHPDPIPFHGCGPCGMG